MFVAMTVAMLHAAIIAHWWDSPQRLSAILVLAVTDAAIAVCALRVAALASVTANFGATRRELDSDIAVLKESL